MFCKNDLPQFKIFLEKKYLKHSTIRGHLQYARFLLPHLHIIDEFLDCLRKKGKTSSYLANLISTIRRIGQFKNIKKFKEYRFPKRNTCCIRATMSDEEIEKFLRLKPLDKRFNKRFYLYSMFFKIMAYTAMRPGEVASLKIDNVDFGRDIFIIEDTKINKPRIVPIPPILKNKLSRYIKGLSSSLLFPKQRFPDKPINGHDWQYQFSNRIKRLGLKRKSLVPYSLRHSWATRMIEADVNIFKIKNLLGHSDIKMTEVYYHTSTKALQETIKQDPLTLKKKGKITCPFCKGKGYVVRN